VITGALLGLLAGIGGWLVVVGAPVRRTVPLLARVRPHLGVAPRGTWWRPVLQALGRRLGSGRAVTERLAVLDPWTVREDAVTAHRGEQLLAGCAGAVATLAVAWTVAGANVPAVLAALAVGSVGGVLARDEVLARAVRRRREEIVADLPAVAELLALSVGAGENVAAAVERVAAGQGPLCHGLRGALGRVRTGTPLLEALTELAGRWQVAPFSRFVDAVGIAVESGSPLAEVLRAQAAEARDAEHRRLLESGGRREVRMLVPVVFAILPVTVVVAVYPGLARLQF
jgi:tight adherence protein C